jgi:hypothetical protein
MYKEIFSMESIEAFNLAQVRKLFYLKKTLDFTIYIYPKSERKATTEVLAWKVLFFLLI